MKNNCPVCKKTYLEKRRRGQYIYYLHNTKEQAEVEGARYCKIRVKTVISYRGEEHELKPINQSAGGEK